MTELEIPYGKFPEYQRVRKELDHARRVHEIAQSAARLATGTLILKEEAYEAFLVSIHAPMAEVIELRPYIENITA